MNKLIRAKAARWARQHIDKRTTPTVRNWVAADALNHLAQAYLAGARSMDAWHRKQTRKPAVAVGVDGLLPAGMTPVSIGPGKVVDPRCPECGNEGQPTATEGTLFCNDLNCDTYNFVVCP